jgi:CubicO group peptidase (beta-lactamase class C family)
VYREHPPDLVGLGERQRRPARGSHPPGTFWYYNNWDFNTLGTIYEQATGTGIYEALDRLIARPIGMQDYRPQDGVYFPGAASTHRAYPLRMSARDLARFGLLYLNKGAWAGKQIVPADIPREPWVCEASRANALLPCRNTWSMSEAQRVACRQAAEGSYKSCLGLALAAPAEEE